jgi:prevent-host-death family protein
MPKTISSSDLRAEIKRVLEAVEQGSTEYVVEKFGHPMAVIISMRDYQLLQEIREEQVGLPIQEVIGAIQLRERDWAPGYLNSLVEEARLDFFKSKSGDTHAD